MVEIICIVLGIAAIIWIFDVISRLADELPSGCFVFLAILVFIFIYSLFR